MPDLIVALRDEIRKQARKEIRASLERTKKLVASHRHEIAELKRLLSDARKRIVFLEGCERKRIADSKVSVSKSKAKAKTNLRFSSKSVRSHRDRLDSRQKNTGCSWASLHKRSINGNVAGVDRNKHNFRHWPNYEVSEKKKCVSDSEFSSWKKNNQIVSGRTQFRMKWGNVGTISNGCLDS